jgi:hypothetical protein
MAAKVMGLAGPVWRTLDIVGAQCLLARTLGHAVGASTQLVSGAAGIRAGCCISACKDC